jgi:hypothetical protein
MNWFRPKREQYTPQLAAETYPKPSSPPLYDPEPEEYHPLPGSTNQDNHEHVLVAIAAQQGVRQPLQPATTVVLFGCTLCSWIREATYTGTWTLEQVTALHRQEGAADAAEGS